MNRELWLPKDSIVIESINVQTKMEHVLLGSIPESIVLGYEVDARVKVYNLFGDGTPIVMHINTGYIAEQGGIQDVIIWHMLDNICAKEHTIYTDWWGGSDHLHNV